MDTMSPTTPSLPLHPCLPLSLCPPFPFPLPSLCCDARICSVPGHRSRTGSRQQICVVTAAGFKNLWSCAGQPQLHTYRVPQSEYLAKSSVRGGRGDIKNPDPKHKNGSVLHKCQRNVILTLILSLPEKVASWDPGTHTHTRRQACWSTRTHFQQAGVRTFPEDLHYC